MPLSFARLAAACALAAAVSASPVAAQAVTPPGTQQPPLSRTPGWAREGGVLAANMVFGGVMGGIAQELRGGSFRDGFSRAALGGAAVYAGKRIAVEDFAGAGLLGREVAAVGSSVMWNAGAGRPSLSRVMLPVGPVNVYVTPGARRPVHLKADLAALIATGYAIAAPELELDAGESLSSGAMVFRAPAHLFRFPSGEVVSGAAYSGTVYLSDAPDPWADERTLPHERVHVIQMDQLFLGAGAHADAWLAAQVPGGRTLHRWVDVNSSLVPFWLLGRAIRRHDQRPWEVEANLMAGTE
ncbi:MAG TPA: hypothetical protein VFQ45_23400 [Longimicrobium sp.]|nr:hypothetical protein [Longimicrobium sp.]